MAIVNLSSWKEENNMNKSTNRELMGYAEEILKDKECLLRNKHGKFFESYNGQISALGVSVLMIGLKATLAIYYQDFDSVGEYKKKAYRRAVLEVIVKMLNKKNNTTYAAAKEFVHEVMGNEDFAKEQQWKTDIINCSVALKQVIRTYEMVKS